jgi:hypothetical protein
MKEDRLRRITTAQKSRLSLANHTFKSSTKLSDLKEQLGKATINRTLYLQGRMSNSVYHTVMQAAHMEAILGQ